MQGKTVKKVNDIFFIMDNGSGLLCPFMQPTPEQGVAGQIKFVYTNCCNRCVHFDIQQKEEKFDITLTCGSKKIFEQLTLEEEKTLILKK